MNIGTSCELCGGTHVHRTGDIGLFNVLGEAGISAGVRRIEAVTGFNALALAQKDASLLAAASAKFKAPAEELSEKIDQVQGEVRALEHDLDRAKSKLAAHQVAGLVHQITEINGTKVLLTVLEDLDPKELRSTVDFVKDQLKTVVVLFAVKTADKLQFCAGVTKNLLGKVKAGELVNVAAAAAGGKGGGRPDIAMAGATDVTKLEAAFSAARTFLTEKL